MKLPAPYPELAGKYYDQLELTDDWERLRAVYRIGDAVEFSRAEQFGSLLATYSEVVLDGRLPTPQEVEGVITNFEHEELDPGEALRWRLDGEDALRCVDEEIEYGGVQERAEKEAVEWPPA